MTYSVKGSFGCAITDSTYPVRGSPSQKTTVPALTEQASTLFSNLTCISLSVSHAQPYLPPGHLLTGLLTPSRGPSLHAGLAPSPALLHETKEPNHPIRLCWSSITSSTCRQAWQLLSINTASSTLLLASICHSSAALSSFSRWADCSLLLHTRVSAPSADSSAPLCHSSYRNGTSTLQ